MPITEPACPLGMGRGRGRSQHLDQQGQKRPLGSGLFEML